MVNRQFLLDNQFHFRKSTCCLLLSSGLTENLLWNVSCFYVICMQLHLWKFKLSFSQLFYLLLFLPRPHSWGLIPCPFVGPKWFWTLPNCFRQVHIRFVIWIMSKNLFSLLKFTLRTMSKFKTILDLSKTIWTYPKQFG